jgi:hypothetical protein
MFTRKKDRMSKLGWGEATDASIRLVIREASLRMTAKVGRLIYIASVKKHSLIHEIA